MTWKMTRFLVAPVACLALWPPASLPAGPSDRMANLSACREDRPSCDRSRLTLSEMTEVARADHARNVDGLGPCDASMLTEPEVAEASLARHQRIVSDCRDGIGRCDHAKLTEGEAAAIPAGPGVLPSDGRLP